MRKIILNVAVSLDGLIEGPNGEYDWCLDDQDYGLTQFLADADAIFIGRKSYELLTKDPNLDFGKKFYIFSDTLTEVKGDAEIISSENLAESVKRLKEEEGNYIWFFGGANLLTTFIGHNYIDELLLSVHPIVLGSGKPLFENLSGRIQLTLMDSIPYSSGLVQLRYRLTSR